MSFLAFADNFLAGALLTMLLPLCLLVAIATWYVVSVRRIPGAEPGPVDPDSVPEASRSAPAGEDATRGAPGSGADPGGRGG